MSPSDLNGERHRPLPGAGHDFDVVDDDRTCVSAKGVAAAFAPVPSAWSDVRSKQATIDRPGIPPHRVTVDGKHFAVASRRFHFRGVTYGTFRPRGDGNRFPERDQVKRDFAAIRDAGFTVVRTYTTPPDDVIELASDWDLRILVGAHYTDWRYLLGVSARQRRHVAREARNEVRAVARRLAGNETVLALSLGNEVPADVVRWTGTREIAATVAELVDVVRSEDSGQLVTYANYPTAEYLPLDSLDFITFNVFLEQRQDLRRYLTRLHHLAGDRPLVLGELGLDSGTTREGEHRQAAALSSQLETAMERGVAGTCVFAWTDEWWVGAAAVEGWHFGLTRVDRSRKPALSIVEDWNRRTVADLDASWPSMTVVICAHNAEATLDECLRHTCTLEYPNLEVLVVDDGSTDATAAITANHPRARLLRIEHAGLSVARNEGFRAARGDVVAYLDSDAYPTPEWPYHLALGFDAPEVAGVGGPNVPPISDPVGAQQVARAPGGPIHVLTTDDRAEHIPGCNMAFWRSVLEEIGGFDPIYNSAGDDVDLCWRLLDRGWALGFHPGALVWHHRRAGLRSYLRQQRGYGRAESLVEARHPDRFTAAGTARWRGRIYNMATSPWGRTRIYRGLYGSAAYQSVYRSGGHALDLAHQIGIPVAVLALLSAPLALLSTVLVVPAALGVVTLAALGFVDAVRAQPPRTQSKGRIRFRLGVAQLHLLQPLVRSWGRARHREPAWRQLAPSPVLPGPIQRFRGGVLLMPEEGCRADVVASVVVLLRRAGLRVLPATGWEDHDGRVLGSNLFAADLVTSSHPIGCVQLRFRRRLRGRALAGAALAVGAAVWLGAGAVAVVASLAFADLGRGLWRTGPYARSIVAAGVDPVAPRSPSHNLGHLSARASR